jgi:hypothetical protein
MSALSQLGIVDLRGFLPKPRNISKATGKPQGRRNTTDHIILHYNGPEAPSRAGGNRDEIVSWLKGVIIPNHVSRIGADGCQYHFWIGADGTIYQVRDLDMLLWHCGSTKINPRSVAVHVPIGGKQKPEYIQWQRTKQLFDALMIDYGVLRQNVKGHKEVGSSACPGPVLMDLLQQWRNIPASVAYKTLYVSVLRSTTRRGFDTIVRTVPVNTRLNITGQLTGESVNGNAIWHQTDEGLFVHSSAIKRV